MIKQVSATVHTGDSLHWLRSLPDCSVDAVVCDPPAGIAFMGAAWDGDKGGRHQWIAWLAEIMVEALRVCKPGAHALVWALPRTSHWTGTALEDAGWEVRDCVTHLFGSGFPKSLAIDKAIDERLGAVREVVGDSLFASRRPRAGDGATIHMPATAPVTAPATDEAKQWAGYGTALKPACEMWYLCRKPIDGTVAGNVLKHGVGGLNLDGCRIGGEAVPVNRLERWSGFSQEVRPNYTTEINDAGRFPANVLFSHSEHCGHKCVDGCPVAELDRQSGVTTSAAGVQNYKRAATSGWAETKGMMTEGREWSAMGNGDTGTASRFFYVAKPSTAEKNLGCEHIPPRQVDASRDPDAPGANNPRNRGGGSRGNSHATVKGIDLMRYLCRLIVPPGGLCVDPFTGSGTTGVACVLEGFRFAGCELDPHHVAIAEARIAAALAGRFLIREDKVSANPNAGPSQQRLI